MGKVRRQSLYYRPDELQSRYRDDNPILAGGYNEYGSPCSPVIEEGKSRVTQGVDGSVVELAPRDLRSARSNLGLRVPYCNFPFNSQQRRECPRELVKLLVHTLRCKIAALAESALTRSLRIDQTVYTYANAIAVFAGNNLTGPPA